MNPSPEHTSAATRRSRRKRWPVMAALAAIAAVAVALMLPGAKANEAIDMSAVGQVQQGRLTVGVDGDEGVIKPGDFRLLTNELEGVSTIISMVDPGTIVKAGDLIIELDASSLKDAKVDQEISVQLADAAHIRSRETLEVIRKQNESNIKVASLNLAFARQDVTKYVEGDYPQQLRNAKSAIILAEGEAEDAKRVHEWSVKLFERRYITQADLNRDKLHRDRKEIDLQSARGSLDLLEQYTHKRDLAQLESDVEARELTLLLVKHRAASDIVDGEADLKAKEIRLKREQEKLAKIEEQIQKSRIVAPIDGMVLYIDDKRDQSGGLAVGSVVRERQWLVRLPTTSKLQAEIKVHESQLRKIKEGMPVEVTTDAVANKVYWGRLRSIAAMPDPPQPFGNPHLKVYTTQVEFTGDTAGLRPGMSCKGRVIVNQFENVTYVPMQAVVQEDDVSVVYMPGPDGSVRQPVTVGMDNNVHVIIKAGLAKGDQILLAPTLNRSYVRSLDAPPQIPPLASETNVPVDEHDPTVPVRNADKPIKDGKPVTDGDTSAVSTKPSGADR